MSANNTPMAINLIIVLSTFDSGDEGDERVRPHWWSKSGGVVSCKCLSALRREFVGLTRRVETRRIQRFYESGILQRRDVPTRKIVRAGDPKRLPDLYTAEVECAVRDPADQMITPVGYEVSRRPHAEQYTTNSPTPPLLLHQ